MRILLALLSALVLASCSGGSGSGGDSLDLGKSANIGGEANEQAKKGMLDRFTTTYQEATSKKDKDGNTITKRSVYDGRSQYQGVKSFGSDGKNRSRYDNKAWQGARDAQKKAYAGNLDGSGLKKQFQGRDQQAKEFGQNARAQGQSFATNNFNTGAARERSVTNRNVADEQRSQFASRRSKKFEGAQIYDARTYQQRSIDETRALLGRE